ncbi:MAG: type II toxin-antitoxin system RelE/ParE family toxin [Lysobacterales bacterium]
MSASRIEFSPEVAGDFERILEHLRKHEVLDLAVRVHNIVVAMEALAHNPLIGRPTPGGNREIVIGRDASGYISLYRYIADMDTIFVLAVRAQKEAGFARP